MTVIVKKHRHIRLLGQIDGNHLHKTPGDYVAEEEYLELCEKALAGDISGLMKILNKQEQRKLFSFLNNMRAEQNLAK